MLFISKGLLMTNKISVSVDKGKDMSVYMYRTTEDSAIHQSEMLCSAQEMWDEEFPVVMIYMDLPIDLVGQEKCTICGRNSGANVEKTDVILTAGRSQRSSENVSKFCCK